MRLFLMICPFYLYPMNAYFPAIVQIPECIDIHAVPINLFKNLIYPEIIL
jgi:hypothetical protein